MSIGCITKSPVDQCPEGLLSLNRQHLTANTAIHYSAMLSSSRDVFTKSLRRVSDLWKIGSSRPLPFFTLEEVSFHDNYYDCWIILFDKIYNVTDFIHNHPGGETVLLEHAGRDATFTFLSAGHTERMMAVLNDYLVGKLPSSEHIFPAEETSE